jgi:hypothetical protein
VKKELLTKHLEKRQDPSNGEAAYFEWMNRIEAVDAASVRV